jgi:hypothetical protein
MPLSPQPGPCIREPSNYAVKVEGPKNTPDRGPCYSFQLTSPLIFHQPAFCYKRDSDLLPRATAPQLPAQYPARGGSIAPHAGGGQCAHARQCHPSRTLLERSDRLYHNGATERYIRKVIQREQNTLADTVLGGDNAYCLCRSF